MVPSGQSPSLGPTRVEGVWSLSRCKHSPTSVSATAFVATRLRLHTFSAPPLPGSPPHPGSPPARSGAGQGRTVWAPAAHPISSGEALPIQSSSPPGPALFASVLTLVLRIEGWKTREVRIRDGGASGGSSPDLSMHGHALAVSPRPCAAHRRISGGDGGLKDPRGL